MLTKDDQNKIIKESLVKHMREGREVPEDIGEQYKNWVRNKVQQASAQLTQQQGPQPEQSQGQEGQGEAK